MSIQKRVSTHRWPSRPRWLVFLSVLLGLGGLVLWSTPGHANAFADARYQLDVTYDEATHSIAGQVRIAALWQVPTPVHTLYCFLPPNMLGRRDPREPVAFTDLRYPKGFEAASLAVQQVTDGQQPLPYTLQDAPQLPVGRVPDQGLLQVTLPRPYNAGERFEIVIAFRTSLPLARNWGHYKGIVALDGLWYPMLVPYHPGEGWQQGMQTFVPAHYTLRLATDPLQEAVASVPWAQRTQQQGQHIFTGSGGPLTHLALSLSATWHRETDSAHTPPVQVLSLPADAPEAATLLRTLQAILAFYQQQFALTLPGPALTVVIHERDGSWPLSVAANHLQFVSRDVMRVPSLIHKLWEYHVARTVVQQWVGVHTTYNLRTERWIGDGLGTYMALRWLDHTYGSGRTFLTWKGSWLPNLSFREQSTDVPYRNLAMNRLDHGMTTPVERAPSSQDLRYLHEKKGAIVYAMLHDRLGPDAFNTFLQRLTMPGQLVTTAHLQGLAEAVSGQDWQAFFQQWVLNNGRLDYAVGTVDVQEERLASGPTVYRNTVEIRRLGEISMPVTVRLLSRDGMQHETQIVGNMDREMVTWTSQAPLSDVQIDPEQRLPDVQRLNNTSHLSYTVRPLFDFPRMDRYLIYPFITLDSNFIDGYTPRLHATALYLGDRSASISVGHKEIPQELSVEGHLLLGRFPHPDMSTALSFTDRQSARTLTLETSLLLEESHQQQRLPANVLSLAYRVAFLDRLQEFNGEIVPANFAPSTGRIHSFVLRYQRDTRIPTALGVPPEAFAEPLAYGYAVRLEAEVASEALGSTRPDFQQVQWDASEFLHIWHKSWLQLRLFGGWSAGTVPLQRKLSLAGFDAVRGYDYTLGLLNDRIIGGTIAVRTPIIRDMRLDLVGRYMGLRGLHVGPFVDMAWGWDQHEDLGDVSPRTSAGVRLISEIGFGSVLRFELVLDLAHPIDKRGRQADTGLQTWIRLQTTVGGGAR